MMKILMEASSDVTFKDDKFERKHITGFEIRAGEVIDAIRVKYENTWGEWHGGTGGDLYQVDLGGSKVAKIEIVRGVYNGSSAVGQITVFTQNNKTHGPYGSVDKLFLTLEKTWKIPSGKGYFTGNTSDYVENLDMQVEEDDDERTGDGDEGLVTYLNTLKCKICNENPPTHAFMYCGHFSACETCSDKIFLQSCDPSCPVCKKQVSNTLRIKL